MSDRPMSDAELKECIAQCCKAMRISSGLADRAMELGDRKCHLYLYELLKEENIFRQERRINKKIDLAGFPGRYVVEDFDRSEVKFPIGCSFEELISLDFWKEHKNVIMYGKTGTGKTMLESILGELLIEKGATVLFFRIPGLVNMFLKYESSGKLEAFLDRLRKASVIILDELGFVPLPLAGVRILFDFLSEIHGKKPVILSTNIEFSQWGTVLHDERLTAALVGRLTENAIIIQFPGKDLRYRRSGLN